VDIFLSVGVCFSRVGGDFGIFVVAAAAAAFFFLINEVLFPWLDWFETEEEGRRGNREKGQSRVMTDVNSLVRKAGIGLAAFL